MTFLQRNAFTRELLLDSVYYVVVLVIKDLVSRSRTQAPTIIRTLRLRSVSLHYKTYSK